MQHTTHLHDDGKDIVSNEWCFLTILGVDVVVHDLHPVCSKVELGTGMQAVVHNQMRWNCLQLGKTAACLPGADFRTTFLALLENCYSYKG